MTLSADFWQSLALTLRLALTVASLLMLIAIPLAQWLNTRRGRWISGLEALLSLPIVLPPTVLGLYLLIAWSPHHAFGAWWLATFHQTLAFSFTGLVFASCLYGLPFVLQPLQAAFRGVDPALLEASIALGAHPKHTFWHIILPVSRHGLLSAAALGFAHTIGEFGLVLMVGGNLPGQTRVASIALFDAAQHLQYTEAHAFAAVLLALSFATLLLVNLLKPRYTMPI